MSPRSWGLLTLVGVRGTARAKACGQQGLWRLARHWHILGACLALTAGSGEP